MNEIDDFDTSTEKNVVEVELENCDVHIPLASNSSPGIASFDSKDFTVEAGTGHVKSKMKYGTPQYLGFVKENVDYNGSNALSWSLDSNSVKPIDKVEVGDIIMLTQVYDKFTSGSLFKIIAITDVVLTNLEVLGVLAYNFDSSYIVQEAGSNEDKVMSQKAATENFARIIDGKIPASQLPSYVDDVLEYATIDSFPVPGESGKIYVDTSTNRTYRWSGSTYIMVGGGDLNLENGEGDQSIVQKFVPHWGSESEDDRNQALSMQSIALGRKCVTTGARSIAIGNECTSSGNSSFVIGQSNTGSGNGSFTGGYYSTNGGNYSLVFGSGNINEKYHRAQLLGWGLTVKEDNTVIVGKFNDYTKTGRTFVVGGGSGDANRSNLFEVLYDGRAKVQSTPTESNDVVRKLELDAKLTAPATPTEDSAVIIGADGSVATKPLSEIGGGGGKLYRHTIFFTVSAFEGNCSLDFLSTKSTAINSFSDVPNGYYPLYLSGPTGTGILYCFRSYYESEDLTEDVLAIFGVVTDGSTAVPIFNSIYDITNNSEIMNRTVTEV